MGNMKEQMGNSTERWKLEKELNKKIEMKGKGNKS